MMFELLRKNLPVMFFLDGKNYLETRFLIMYGGNCLLCSASSWTELVLCRQCHFFLVSVASLVPQRSLRNKRGLLELAGVIKCSTGRSALAYMMYGCYCGLGGQGWPRDRADW